MSIRKTKWKSSKIQKKQAAKKKKSSKTIGQEFRGCFLLIGSVSSEQELKVYTHIDLLRFNITQFCRTAFILTIFFSFLPAMGVAWN